MRGIHVKEERFKSPTLMTSKKGGREPCDTPTHATPLLGGVGRVQALIGWIPALIIAIPNVLIAVQLQF